MSIYDNIAEIAARRGISIQRLEKKAGLANGAIGKWKKGGDPQLRSVVAVADALGVSVNRLLREAEK